jgi:hypothetical protein
MYPKNLVKHPKPFRPGLDRLEQTALDERGGQSHKQIEEGGRAEGEEEQE